MKILQFVTRLDLGGAQETCLEQCRLLLERGHEVHLLTGEGGELMEDARRVAGLRVHVWESFVHPVRPFRDLGCLVRLARLLRSERYDVLHTHCSKAGLVGRLAAALSGARVRVIHHVHGWSFHAGQWALQKRLYVLLERLAARRGFQLIACSEATAEQGRRARIGRAEDLHVVHYGIDRRPCRRAHDREAIRRRLGLGRRDVLFVQLGNLKPQKDPITFARAAVEAGRQLGRGRFWIVGDGPLREEAERVAREGGLGERFRVLGWRRDVPEILAAADVLVLTSRFEGLPIAVLRGMAAGLPVVATSVDGTPEAVEDGRTGRLVPPGDPVRTAAALLMLGRSPSLRRSMGRRGRERSDRFGRARAAAETLRVYAGALPGGVGLHPAPN